MSASMTAPVRPALPVASTTLGQRVAHGAATMSVSSAGTHPLMVKAIDVHGPASATCTFAVVVGQPRTLYGASFFDVDGDGRCAAEDFDLSTVTVKLYTAANGLVRGEVTNSRRTMRSAISLPARIAWSRRPLRA